MVAPLVYVALLVVVLSFRSSLPEAAFRTLGPLSLVSAVNEGLIRVPGTPQAAAVLSSY